MNPSIRDRTAEPAQTLFGLTNMNVYSSMRDCDTHTSHQHTYNGQPWYAHTHKLHKRTQMQCNTHAHTNLGGARTLRPPGSGRGRCRRANYSWGEFLIYPSIEFFFLIYIYFSRFNTLRITRPAGKAGLHTEKKCRRARGRWILPSVFRNTVMK